MSTLEEDFFYKLNEEISQLDEYWYQLEFGKKLQSGELRCHKKRQRIIIHDTIHGSVEIPAFLVDLLDSPPLQRLAFIQQLGVASKLYPTANYSRLEHAIGTYWVARRLLETIKGKDVINAKGEKERIDIQPQDEHAVWAAALLHDVGHLPLSHTLEKLFGSLPIPKKLHEYIGARILQTEYFKEKFARIKQVYDITINPSDIGELITGTNFKDPKRQFLADIVSGTIDADRIDYLQRDAYNIGFPGLIDAERLVNNVAIVENPEVPGQFVLAVAMKAVEASLSLLQAKERLDKLVYKHHVTVVSEELILRQMQESFQGIIDMLNIVGQNDFDLYERLKNGEFYKRYLIRNLPKRYVCLSVSDPSIIEEKLKPIVDFSNKYRKVEEIADQIKVPNRSLFLDIQIEGYEDIEAKMKSVWLAPSAELSEEKVPIRLSDYLRERYEWLKPKPSTLIRTFLDWEYIYEKWQQHNGNPVALADETRQAVAKAFGFESDSVKIERYPKEYKLLSFKLG